MWAWFLFLGIGDRDLGIRGTADQVKVEVGNILVGAAVSDKAVAGCFQIEFGYQALYGLEKVCHKIGIGRGKIAQCVEIAPRDKQDVQRVAGAGMVKGQ